MVTAILKVWNDAFETSLKKKGENILPENKAYGDK
jgi:hypothetical protein